MTTIIRLTDTIIVVDGINCELSDIDGKYYPIREDLMNVSLFTTIIDNYLIAEEKINEDLFNEDLDDMLYEARISYSGGDHLNN
jgi:hypothetical protein